MVRTSAPTAFACAIALAAVATSAIGQERQVYRYTDPEGRIIYSDRAPPSNAKDVQAKRLGANFIENSQLPIASQQAMERYPVTLYTFQCGEICQSAEGLLNKRGVPFSMVNVEDAKGAEQLKNLTGEVQAPVLQVGDRMIAKGFNEAKWQAMLDDAGYPKAPASRRVSPTARAPEPAPAAKSDETASATAYPKN